MEKQIVIITGTSSGIGQETALFFARKGFYVFATMRNLAKSDSLRQITEKENLPLEIIKLDVLDQNSIDMAIQKITQKTNHIDILINNAGYGLFGCLEEVSSEELKNQFETNVFGVHRMCKVVLPFMRKQNYGKIINVSSALGRVALPLNGSYCASKISMEALSESLRMEVKQFGVDVVIVEPGTIESNFSNSSKKVAKAIQDKKSPYYEYFKNGEKAYSSSVKGNPPIIVAKKIYHIIKKRNPKTRYVVGMDTFMLVKLRWLLPDSVFQFAMKKMIG